MLRMIFQSVLYFSLIVFFNVIHAHNVTIWGPGLFPDKIILPARYFFVKDMEIDESNYHSGLKDRLKISVSGVSSTGSCRVWYNILDRKDGSFIVRYRLYNTCRNFKISVKYNDTNVGDSPYTFKGYILPEDCDCPVQFSQWIHNMQCKHTFNQISSDLAPFAQIDVDATLLEVEKRYNQPGRVSLCHYVIKSNKIYRKCYGKHVGFNMFSDAILLSLVRKYVFSDTSFFINLGDWPLAKVSDKPLAILSWCGSEDTFDIVLPTYDITESTIENMRRVSLDMLSVQGNIDEMWEKKIPKAFWRGRDSHKERLKLIEIGKKHPDLYNVSITNYFMFRDKEKDYGKSPSISFFKFFDYKYQINIDGSVAAYRFPYLLAGNSVVFKQDSPYYEHFYGDLQPHIHFIPFKSNLSDLTSKLKWAISNDIEARTISQNGANYARENLMPKDIYCYHARVFEEYIRRVISPIKIYPGMEEVPQSNETKSCQCEFQLKDEF